ncbi:hypothetical protein SISNIDRAFT_409700 [Sistotremastrum niveocremeum HHB9708]|uniref:Sorting nexin MVP1 n=1 Tax=Sistotremastrum niveocremeum HHB9708 TaxID=1314777 RepID=A0A164VNX2_9AGAM|nr:hypothetical protein SISNIDRAFT_409700 [Sistotremastrum niveocremeum HHB9708]
MFNAPRLSQNRYQSTNNGFGGASSSFLEDSVNPLTSSSYDGLDPWSAAPTPPPPEVSSSFANVIADATVPAIYTKAFAAVDPNATGEVSVNSLVRVMSTSSLPAATIEKIVNLVSSKPRVSKLEFFVALALVAFAQESRELSIEQVAAHAQQNTLPEPVLDLSALSATTSARRTPDIPIRSPAPAYSSDDPWNSTNRVIAGASAANGPASSVAGSGLPSGWWKRQETVSVSILGQQGFILNRYMLYQIQHDRGSPVPRRYSEFVWLWDCLVKRYPFRILPSLPPKRVGPDENFIQQRRKGLSRFLNYVVNHPVIKEDGLLAVFLGEPSLEAWRKQHPLISLDEESASKHLDRVEEMSIPSDLEEKLAIVRKKIQNVIEQWQKLCFIAERLIRRREGAASDLQRFSLTLSALNEVNAECWRGEDCELCSGVRTGLDTVGSHAQHASDLLEQRSRALMNNTLESMKAQRDLYIAVRDLYIRHDRLSGDQVEKLKKRVEQNSSRLEGLKSSQKDGWQTEAEKYIGLIEKDQAAIAAALSRRVFVRHCMWHELRVVLHNRENALLTQAVQLFAREEASFSKAFSSNWVSLTEGVENMPFE